MPHQLLTISHHIARVTFHNPPANVLKATHAFLEKRQPRLVGTEA
jgi:hypothetical protein